MQQIEKKRKQKEMEVQKIGRIGKKSGAPDRR